MVRFKNRYIVLEIIPDQINRSVPFTVDQTSIFRAIIRKVQQLHGDFGCAAINLGFIVKYSNPQLRIALVRVRHGPHRLVTSALPFINMINSKKIVMHTLYMGATMRNCFKFLTKYQQKKISTELAQLKGTPQYDQIIKEYMNLSIIK